MRIEKLMHSIVCDFLGCGKLARKAIVTDGGQRIDVCDDCLKKLKECVKEKKDDE